MLVGIWEHGLGSWEQVKVDKALDLGGKIRQNASRKPQSKYLDVRTGCSERCREKLSKAR